MGYHIVLIVLILDSLEFYSQNQNLLIISAFISTLILINLAIKRLKDLCPEI